MGLIIDSDVFIMMEKEGVTPDFNQFRVYGDAFISVITVSELLVGVHRASGQSRKMKRAAFVEVVLNHFPALPFADATARVHAEIFSDLQRKGKMIGAHDLIIASTALLNDFPVLTHNRNEFERVRGLTVLGL
jgi:tRNA(fMet)-specific endonuclease VapC